MYEIAKGAFDGCINLISIQIPYGISYIAPSLFLDCESLSDVYIPDSIESILADAFQECFSLKVLDIPKSVEWIAPTAFYGIESKIKIYAHSDYVAQYCERYGIAYEYSV